MLTFFDIGFDSRTNSSSLLPSLIDSLSPTYFTTKNFTVGDIPTFLSFLPTFLGLREDCPHTPPTFYLLSLFAHPFIFVVSDSRVTPSIPLFPKDYVVFRNRIFPFKIDSNPP